MHLPFFLAILIHFLQIFLDNDADIEAVEDEGLTPLHFAGIYGSTEAAEVQSYLHQLFSRPLKRILRSSG